MAESDWNVLTNSLSIGSLARAATAGITRPNGGGSFVFGFNSLEDTTGASGLFANQANFNPIANGGRITAALQRSIGAFDDGYNPIIFFNAQGTDVNDTAYLLGLSDAEPARIILRKGTISGGIPDLTPDPTVNGNLMASTATYTKGTWVHLQFDVIVNPNGEVILQVFQNDLDTNLVTSPIWSIVPGMEGPQTPEIDGFIDDALQLNTGSAPLLTGRAGIAMAVSGEARGVAFDHITLARKT